MIKESKEDKEKKKAMRAEREARLLVESRQLVKRIVRPQDTKPAFATTSQLGASRGGHRLHAPGGDADADDY